MRIVMRNLAAGKKLEIFCDEFIEAYPFDGLVSYGEGNGLSIRHALDHRDG